MYNDLEVIANLEFGKVVQRISLEVQESIRRVQTIPRGGHMEHARLKVCLDQAEEKCRAYAQIWQDWLGTKNDGHLTREDVAFIIRKVQQVVAESKRSLMSKPSLTPAGC